MLPQRVEGVAHKKLREAAALLVQGGRDEQKEEEALAAFGLKLEGETDDEGMKVWPENWKPLKAFDRMMTQWRVSAMGSPTGLCYDALPLMLEVCEIERAEWPEVVDCVQIMERHALGLLNK